jgi:hypothetical protein
LGFPNRAARCNRQDHAFGQDLPEIRNWKWDQSETHKVQPLSEQKRVNGTAIGNTGAKPDKIARDQNQEIPHAYSTL